MCRWVGLGEGPGVRGSGLAKHLDQDGRCGAVVDALVAERGGRERISQRGGRDRNVFFDLAVAYVRNFWLLHDLLIRESPKVVLRDLYSKVSQVLGSSSADLGCSALLTKPMITIKTTS